MTNRMEVLLSVFMLAACSSGAPHAHVGAVLASDDARAWGVFEYRIGTDRVEVFGTDGASLGVLTVAAPDAEKREVRIDYVGAPQFGVDVFKPLDGHFTGPLFADREGYLLTDPALAEFFSRSQLAFVLADFSGKPMTELGPEVSAPTAACTMTLPPNYWASVCSDQPSRCVNGSQTVSNTVHHGVNNAYLSPGCSTACGTYVGKRRGLIGNNCDCYDFTSWSTRKAYCPVVSCGPYGTYDETGKIGLGNAAGLTSYQAVGATGCVAPDGSVCQSYDANGQYISGSNTGGVWTPTLVYSDHSCTYPNVPNGGSCGFTPDCAAGNTCQNGTCWIPIGSACWSNGYQPGMCAPGVPCNSTNGTCKYWETCICGHDGTPDGGGGGGQL